MGLEFIDRSLKASGIVLLVFLPFGLYYLGIFPSLALFSGGIWGMLNLIFISAMVRSVVRPGGVDRGRAIGLAVFKFPILYVSGYFLLKVPQFDPLYLLIGFTSIFAVIVLRVLGRLVTSVGDQSQEGGDLRSLA